MIYLCKPNRVARSYVGGRHLDELRGAATPADGLYPEEWIASVTSAKNAGGGAYDGLSKCDDGVLLRDVIAAHPAEMLGSWACMPILLKLLDASERLVIQAHPTRAFARQYFGSEFGKAECWYILRAEADAHVYLGFRPGITRAKWRDCFERQDIETMLALLHRIPVRAGDVWYVEGGVPHAIGGGCLMAELQEPTDLMVIPERVTPSGRALPDWKLHGGLGFAHMLDCFDYTGYDEAALRARWFRRPARACNASIPVIDASLTERFAMDEYEVAGECPICKGGAPAVAVVLAGEGTISGSDGLARPVRRGDGLFLPADEMCVILRGALRCLVAKPASGANGFE